MGACERSVKRRLMRPQSTHRYCAGDVVSPSESSAPHATKLLVRRRFQFSSSLNRMSTVSHLPNGKCIAAIKGAPEAIRTMLATVPEAREHEARLDLITMELVDLFDRQVIHLFEAKREHAAPPPGVPLVRLIVKVLVFLRPLMPDAIEAMKMLGDSSHTVSFWPSNGSWELTSVVQCIMITGDNPLTAAHVARDVEIVDRYVLIDDAPEGESSGKYSGLFVRRTLTDALSCLQLSWSGGRWTRRSSFPLILLRPSTRSSLTRTTSA